MELPEFQRWLRMQTRPVAKVERRPDLLNVSTFPDSVQCASDLKRADSGQPEVRMVLETSLRVIVRAESCQGADVSWPLVMCDETMRAEKNFLTARLPCKSVPISSKGPVSLGLM
jgi:hypothetical protein